MLYNLYNNKMSNDKKSIVKLIGSIQHGKNKRKVGDKTAEKIYFKRKAKLK